MHPVDKKNRIISYLIIISSVIVTTLTAYQNSSFLFSLVAIFLLAAYQTEKFKHFIVLTCLLSLALMPSFNLMKLFFGSMNPKEQIYESNSFAMVYFGIMIFAAAPLFVLSQFFKRVVRIINNQKQHYQLIESQPHLICTHHFTRTFKEDILGYKSVKCRIGKDCLQQKHIQKASKLVGLIGIIENGKTVDGDYHTTLWDYRYRKIRYGDFDIIEIHSNKKIKDYDFIISKIITFYSNEINNYKPLNRIEVKIIGQPAISENTKRLMEKYFYKVEVVQEELEAVLL